MVHVVARAAEGWEAWRDLEYSKSWASRQRQLWRLNQPTGRGSMGVHAPL